MKKSIIITIAILCTFVLCVNLCDSSEKNESDKSTNDSISTEVIKEEVVTESNTKTSWKYHEEVDEMTDKISYYAWVTSENEVNFDFPYNGGSNLKFTVRDSPQYGKDIYIKISSGQFNSGLNGMPIKIRFDENPAFTVYCNEASDGSTDVLFLKNYSSIIKKLKEAKRMKISAEFFDEGNHTFTFDVEGLEWNH